jgi:hypothetical protein
MKKEIIHEIERELKVTQESILKAYPSIYSKQDVLQMLNGFVENITRWVTELPEENAKASTMSLDRVEELSELLIKTINNKIERLDSNDVVDYSSASFSIGYDNRIEIDSIDLIESEITDVVENTVDEVLRDFFTPEEEEIVNETPYATEQ